MQGQAWEISLQGQCHVFCVLFLKFNCQNNSFYSIYSIGPWQIGNEKTKTKEQKFILHHTNVVWEARVLAGLGKRKSSQIFSCIGLHTYVFFSLYNWNLFFPPPGCFPLFTHTHTHTHTHVCTHTCARAHTHNQCSWSPGLLVLRFDFYFL